MSCPPRACPRESVGRHPVRCRHRPRDSGFRLSLESGDWTSSGSAAARRPLLHLESPARASESSPGQARAGAWARRPPRGALGQRSDILLLSPDRRPLGDFGGRGRERGPFVTEWQTRASLGTPNISRHQLLKPTNRVFPLKPLFTTRDLASRSCVSTERSAERHACSGLPDEGRSRISVSRHRSSQLADAPLCSCRTSGVRSPCFSRWCLRAAQASVRRF